MLEATTFGFAETAMVKAIYPASIFSISAFQGAEQNLNAALGVTLPVRPIFLIQNGVTYMWSGPSAWLVFDAEPATLALATGLAAVTEQTDGRAVFQVSGQNTRQALAKLVPIDLHRTAFPVGATALTLAGHINVQIWREAENDFALACFRSFANALYRALTTACREFES